MYTAIAENPGARGGARLPPRRLVAVLMACGLLASSLGGTAHAHATPPGPLAREEVTEYLGVMRKTADRIAHPTAEDRDAAARSAAAEKRQSAAYSAFQARHRDGSIPSKAEIADLTATNPGAEDTVAMNRVHTLRLAPDTLIVQSEGIDLPHYLAIKRKIERLVLIANEREVHGEHHDRDRDPDRDAQERERAAPPAALSPSDSRDEALLKPSLPEIRRLLRIVLQGRELDSD